MLIVIRDEERVNKRFQDAEKHGIIICQGTISCSSILKHLPLGPVIILTNAKLLSCDVCKYNKLTSEVQKMLRWPVTYQGHYIVLCGFDVETQRVYYRNPTLTDRICVMPIRTLDDARKSYGTDEDTILIYNS
ncbi:hypothetical protein WA026_012752 [Henosepilachna vigintioctopunctata]|uniref:Uncharacterized protein n=1 Tax=Henosepilachna vigintioctopunctata TaxID=420089 RepID=A0AAW1U0M1_9CUCU